MFGIMAASTGGSSESITAVLGMATEVLTWLITSMGSVVSFMFAHPLILSMFLLMLCGAALGFLFRIFHSV